MESTIYRVIDCQTGKQVGSDYKYAQRNRARAMAERKNLEYGAHRFSARPVFADEQGAAN